MSELSMSQCVGKKLNRVNNEWLYRFKCCAAGCDRVFGVPRPKIEGHTGLCKPHHAQYLADKRAAKTKTVTVDSIYATLRASAKSSKRELHLTVEQMELLTHIKECAYCGDEIPWFKTTAYFLDRIDNSGGYDVGNVAVCCSVCNMTRGARFTAPEMRIIGKAIREVKQLRKLSGKKFRLQYFGREVELLDTLTE